MLPHGECGFSKPRGTMKISVLMIRFIDAAHAVHGETCIIIGKLM
jgi:hypothetical protein